MVEMVLVVAIIGALAGIAIPRYARSLARYRVDAAGRRIEADLRVALERARAVSAAQTVTFFPDKTGYQLDGLDNPYRDGRPYIVTLTGEPYRVSIVSVTFGGDLQVTFDGFGRPDSGGEVVVQSGDLRKRVVLDAESGKATSDPATLAP